MRPSFIFSRWFVVWPTVCHHVIQKPAVPPATVWWPWLRPGVVMVEVHVGEEPPESVEPVAIVRFGCGRFCVAGPSNVTVIGVFGHGPPPAVSWPVPRFG